MKGNNTIASESYRNYLDRIWINQWAVFIDKDPESQIDVREYNDLDELTKAVCNKLGIEFSTAVKFTIKRTWMKYCPMPKVVTDEFLKQKDLSLIQLGNLSTEQLERRCQLLGIKCAPIIRKRNGTYLFLLNWGKKQ